MGAPIRPLRHSRESGNPCSPRRAMHTWCTQARSARRRDVGDAPLVDGAHANAQVLEEIPRAGVAFRLCDRHGLPPRACRLAIVRCSNATIARAPSGGNGRQAAIGPRGSARMPVPPFPVYCVSREICSIRFKGKTLVFPF